MSLYSILREFHAKEISPEQLSREISDVEQRIKAQIRDDLNRGKAVVGECKYCDDERLAGSTFHPRHNASPRCESGGRNHCTCDTCF